MACASSRVRRAVRSVAVALACAGVTAAHAGPEDDPKPRPIDPGIFPGGLIRYAERPVVAPDLRACGARAPVCIHARSSGDGPAALAALAAFERAWETLTGALGLHPPDLDPYTLAYDVYLVEGIEDGALVATDLEARDVRSRVDRGRAFTRLDRRVESGCVLDTIAAEAIARASLHRTAPATDEGSALGQAAYLATLAIPCALGRAVDAVHAFQSRPERALCDAHAGDDTAAAGATPIVPAGGRLPTLFAAGGATFWARLDWAYGRSPGRIVPATWALHPTMTPVGAARWANEPDTFDVLRMTFKGALTTGGTVDDLWLDFGIARAFAGSADDRFHVPELRGLGDAARVPLDWDVAWPAAPRRYAARAPVQPTGASYLLVRHGGARPGARLRAEIEWEEHALFRWAFVKIDANGRELGRVLIPSKDRATSAAMTLVDMDGADRILLVGVNVGDPAYGFDPDDEVWEPHGWLVTLAEE